MIILDTNVISVMMQDSPDPSVVRWLNRQEPDDLRLTAVTLYEIRLGIEVLPAGRRRSRLELAVGRIIETEFAGRILPLDGPSADAAARLQADNRRAGHPIAIPDVLIAGIARSTGAIVATRNTRHFSGLGVPLLNPWEFSG